jgi:hypothetical protein
MATHYSIDLGIDANATAGASGTESDPYPLQIGLTAGALVQGSNRQYHDFLPKALASFTQMRSGDVLIFSVFNITSIGSKGDRSFMAPQPIQIKLTSLDGTSESPLTLNSALLAGLSPARNQRSLAFATKPDTFWPCFFQLNASDGIAVNPIGQVTSPASFLLTVTVPVVLMDPAGVLATFYFQADPELVVSPDEGPGSETALEERAPGQPPAIAATSR